MVFVDGLNSGRPCESGPPLSSLDYSGCDTKYEYIPGSFESVSFVTRGRCPSWAGWSTECLVWAPVGLLLSPCMSPSTESRVRRSKVLFTFPYGG